MIPPLFDITRTPINPWDSNYMSAVIAEEERVCGPIDRRMEAMNESFFKMSDEFQALSRKYHETNGFFKKWSICTKMIPLRNRIVENRRVYSTLASMRLRRTYGS